MRLTKSKKFKADDGRKLKKQFFRDFKRGVKGITLVALVVTIIVLLILAGVAINLTVGDNGIFKRAEIAANTWRNAETNEQLAMDELSGMIDTLGKKVYTEVVDGKTMTAVIPEGFTISTKEGENTIKDGLVIVDGNGNEYVWIPCTLDGEDGTVTYARKEWTVEIDGADNSRASKDELTLLDEGVSYPSADTNYGINKEVAGKIIEQINAEKESIRKYKGFYIGRYETGKENEKAVIKKNVEPYASIQWQEAYKLANEIDVGSGATSYLCSSYAWDTAIKYIESKANSSDYGTNISKYNGNWKPKQVVDEEGKEIKPAGTAKRLNTGLTTPLCNIYDMGGNVSEFTTELNPGTSESVVLRGGNADSVIPAGYRSDDISRYAYTYIGFRATLFIK